MMLRVELHKLDDTPPSPVGTQRKLSNKPPSRDTPPVSLPDPTALSHPGDTGPSPNGFYPHLFCPLLVQMWITMRGTVRHVQRRTPGVTCSRKRSWRSRRKSWGMHWSRYEGTREKWRRRWRTAQVRDTDVLFTEQQFSSNNKAACVCVSVCVCVGFDLEERIARLETLCKQKEEERVELELKLTEVKENLKKSLARGSAGSPTENKLILKVAAKK